jgi:prepilin-type N-terminal cleavage/methylation domain-containing protein
MKMRKQTGFTLVEIAIVLVIIGLLLGGILKGQELVQNARVRNVADQQSAIKAAWFAFQDRYRAFPGDYLAAQANANLPNTTAAVGNGNGLIDAAEEAQAWAQLTVSGFLACSQCAPNPAGATALTQANSMLNAYNGVMVIQGNNAYSHNGAATGPVRNNLKSGSQIPSNVLAEVDRKIDDGNPQTGELRFSGVQTIAAGALQPAANTCAPIVAVPGGAWIANNPDPNCGAAFLF